MSCAPGTEHLRGRQVTPIHSSAQDCRGYSDNPRDSCGWVSRSLRLAGRPQGEAEHHPQESQSGTSPLDMGLVR